MVHREREEVAVGKGAYRAPWVLLPRLSAEMGERDAMAQDSCPTGCQGKSGGLGEGVTSQTLALGTVTNQF